AMDIMDSGRMAFIIDPTGAALGLWQAIKHVGSDSFNEPGFMTWNELATRDPAAATDFYTKLFGWKPGVRDHDGFEYTTFMRGDRPNGGAFDMSQYLPPETPPHWAVYFAVDDADAAAEAAGGLGGTIVRAPSESEFGRMSVLLDPYGAMFSIIALTRVS
ncbi:MAG: VOC family protein, partial [Acidimicrobiia bacterium]|nr:VOC family protein [Acidimicrobiia bacterium]